MVSSPLIPVGTLEIEEGASGLAAEERFDEDMSMDVSPIVIF
jgi:hypothetical protein